MNLIKSKQIDILMWFFGRKKNNKKMLWVKRKKPYITTSISKHHDVITSHVIFPRIFLINWYDKNVHVLLNYRLILRKASGHIPLNAISFIIFENHQTEFCLCIAFISLEEPFHMDVSS